MSVVIAPVYDVVVLGGGLAGLTFALHLKQLRPETTVLVVEKLRHPVAEAAHKVGESSVEVGAHYFARVLGQLEHFRTEQLPKLGLRYFFDGDERRALPERTELGGNTFFPTESFQIDRGRFENHLGVQVRAAGADLADGASVRGVELGTHGEDSVVTVRTADGEEHPVRARWVIDASGRASLLKRKLGLAKKNGHDANAVWWRYDRRIAVDDWSDDDRWQNHTGGRRQRWLSTVHLMGAGYWVWFIPLSSGSHSVGIVADGKLHPFGTLASYEKAMAWLREHEPEAAAQLAGREDQLQDFLALKDFSYSCTRLFSADRWALVGEAGAFLDPFYSPGSDYIAMGNTLAADLVVRSLAGERLGARAEVYNRIFLNFFENHLSLYEGQMPLFGDAKVMALKIIWDFAYYWAVPASFFFHGRLTDMLAFARHRDALDRVGALNRAVQALFRPWHAAGIRIEPVFVNIPGIPFMHALNRGLRDALEGVAFEERLLHDLALLERLAAELATEARRDIPSLAFEGPLGMLAELPLGEGNLLAGVLPLLQRREAVAAS